jgi:hypothetical protein
MRIHLTFIDFVLVHTTKVLEIRDEQDIASTIQMNAVLRNLIGVRLRGNTGHIP